MHLATRESNVRGLTLGTAIRTCVAAGMEGHAASGEIEEAATNMQQLPCPVCICAKRLHSDVTNEELRLSMKILRDDVRKFHNVPHLTPVDM